jgi:DNA-binding PadR family transcriptional regulator
MHREAMYSRRMTEQALFILASLAKGDLHGYGIARDVEELSEGRIRLTAGTIYGALNRLSDDGLVAPAGEQQVQGRRRRYYRLTPAGHTVLAAEVERLRSSAAALGARVTSRATPGLA